MRAIDLHVHILPVLDDGASSWEEAVSMARVAAASGTEALVATPHFLPGSWPEPGRVRELAQELQERVNGCRLPLRVYPGCEVYLEPEMVERLGKLVPLGGNGPYLLLELPLSELPPYTEEVLFRLRLKEIVPVLAHPERNRVLGEDLSVLAGWIRQGVLVQLNAGSLTGTLGRRVQQTAEKMVKARMVHFLGSDGHSASKRCPVLGQARERVARIVGEEEAERIAYRNAALLLAGQEIEVPEPAYPLPRRGGIWGFLWGKR